MADSDFVNEGLKYQSGILDGYLGRLLTPGDIDSSTIITGCKISVEEIEENNGELRTLASARFSLFNFDIYKYSEYGITSVNVEMAYFASEGDYAKPKQELPKEWVSLGSAVVSVNKNGIYGSDNRCSFVVNGIPASPSGYYHKFRLSFFNWQGEIARLIPEYDQRVYDTVGDVSIPDISVPGTFAQDTYLFTTTEDQSWVEDEYIGFSSNAYNSLYSYCFVENVPIIDNGSGSIKMSRGVEFTTGIGYSDISRIRFVESQYFYVLGDGGSGIKFNGKGTLEELVPVDELFVRIIDDDPETIINEEVWITGIELNKSLKSNKTTIKFTNMFAHVAMNGVVLANGDIADISSKQMKTVTHYDLFCYISDSPGDTPVNSFPVTDETDSGKWYYIKKIAGFRNTATNPYLYETIYDLPRGRYFTFYLGCNAAEDSTMVTKVPIAELE